MNYIEKVIENHPALAVCKNELEQAVTWIVGMHRAKGILLLCGNGGSAADCEHISGELLKGFLSLRPLPQEERIGISPALAETLQGGIRAIPLVSLTAVGTAFGNDVAAQSVYAQLVHVFGDRENVFLGISTSGNAANVCAAAEVARARGQKTIALTGEDGGRLARMCGCAIRVPAGETYLVQELHLPVYHALCAEVEARIFGKE